MAEAAMHYSAGNKRTSAAILRELGLNSSARGTNRVTKKANCREHKRVHKHAAAESVLGASRKWLLNANKQ